MIDEYSNAKKVIESLIPDAKVRNIFLSMFLESLLEANKYGANKWGAYYTNDKIRLVVGSLIVLTVEKQGIWVTLDKQFLDRSIEELRLLEHSNDWHWDTGSWSEYKDVPSKNGYYVPSEDHPQTWPLVRRLHFAFIENVSNKYAQLRESSKHKNMPDLLAYLRYTLNQPVPEPVYEDSKGTKLEYPLDECAIATGFDIKTLERWVRAINRKGQAILYGPPGTGKTYVAEHLAKHLVGGGHGFVEMIQFHPAYAYEDFIQGIRPQSRDDGGLDYPVVPGRFLTFCEQAESSQGVCVLIIDEINRANLARVFGELMYLLEYRNRELPLAGGGHLHIPSNVRIIGTMNTADRSIALVDHALRRRFAFLPLYPNYEVLKLHHQGTGFEVEGLIKVLKQVNNQIGDKHYEVGISFFLRDDLDVEIEDIWEMEIEPYLEDFFFDQQDKVNDYRWDNVRETIGL